MKNKFSKLNRVLILMILAMAVFSFQPDHSYSTNGKVILKSGDPKAFTKYEKLKLEFSYDELKVGEYNTEFEYTDKKVSEQNKKTAGKGDSWLVKWNNAKENVWPGRFETLYNKGLVKKNLKCDRNAQDVECTLKVSVVFIEPGFNVGVVKRPASASFRFFLITNVSKEVLAELFLNNVPGEDAMGFDYDTDKRVGESFAKAGKMLAAYIAKQKK